MKIKTSITDIRNGREFVRGQDLSVLMKEHSFTEVIFIILRGSLPTAEETKMMDAMLVAAIDHGPGTASGQVARIVASAKNSMHVSVAAAILAMGERHGSAIEGAGEFFQEHSNTENIEALVGDLKLKKLRVPGFGHPFLEVDERSRLLFGMARELGFYGVNCTFAERFHEEINRQSSKKLALNIDGSMGAILSDMGFDHRMMKGVFIIARVPGLVAHIYEEEMNDVGIRRMDQGDIEFVA
jgi:citryl-CoA lyase